MNRANSSTTRSYISSGVISSGSRYFLHLLSSIDTSIARPMAKPVLAPSLKAKLKATEIMLRGIDAITMLEDFDTFIASLKQARALDPVNVNIKLFYAFFSMLSSKNSALGEDYKTARKICEEILLKDPQNPVARLINANYYFIEQEILENKIYLEKQKKNHKKEIISNYENRKTEMLKKGFAEIDNYAKSTND